MDEVAQTAKPEFPSIFVEYAREKMRKDKDLVEYLAQFGHPFLKGGAQMIIAAAREGEKIGK
uniref:Uncharacterized protein n=1 Tax=viral metagenome TaxID=1070528 RepID=A0A6M3LT66_9ZZZZ